ncbi:TATA box-binding protein-associated factor RNA polymerase I subunit D [Carettochelys insculpta]|uniref:TATA box-binding protein-associated factor RNA polymerase I subunit D n=1 Tax=Carettochelys insculpta TaxID=44489 RepID=UPI003EB8A786
MLDTDEAKTPAFDHFEDSQDLIHAQEQSSVNEHVTAMDSFSGFIIQDSRCEKSSQEPYMSGRSSKCSTHLTTVPISALLDDSDSDSSLFQPESNITLSAPSSTKCLAKSPANVGDFSTDSSPDPGSPKRLAKSPQHPRSSLNLKAIFDYHRRRKQHRRQAHKKGKEKAKEKSKSTGKPTGRPPLTASKEDQKRRLLDRGFQFPFVEREYGQQHLPMKMILEYEEAALQGYFQYIKILKYEEHVKKALKELNASEDLEKESIVMRKRKYLDDEGPISPIQETNGDDNLNPDQEEIGAKIVENSCFILSSKLPRKRKTKTKAKHSENEEKEHTDVPGSV